MRNDHASQTASSMILPAITFALIMQYSLKRNFQGHAVDRIKMAAAEKHVCLDALATSTQ